jgi:hypothetical protein
MRFSQGPGPCNPTRAGVRNISVARLRPPIRWRWPAVPGHRNRCGVSRLDQLQYMCPAPRHGTDKEIPMRILALTILAIGMAAAMPSAHAQTYDPNYPVCLQIYQSWKDYYFECAYTSLAQCNMSASGRAAQCIVNPYYAGPKPRSRRYRRVY